MPLNLQPSGIYRHVQESASNAWTIVHGMATYPIVDVYILANGVVQKILPLSVVYVDQNTVRINFSTPQTGFATVAG